MLECRGGGQASGRAGNVLLGDVNVDKEKFVKEIAGTSQYPIEIRPFAYLIELENDSQNTLELKIFSEDSIGCAVLAFCTFHRQTANLCLYRYYGSFDHRNNYMTQITLTAQRNPEAVKQFGTKYVAVSTMDGIEVFDILMEEGVHKINVNQPFQNIIRINPKGFSFNNCLIKEGEACLGYSYKNLYSIGISTGELTEGIDDENLSKEQEKFSHGELAKNINFRNRMFTGDVSTMTYVQCANKETGKISSMIYYCLSAEDGTIHRVPVTIM